MTRLLKPVDPRRIEGMDNMATPMAQAGASFDAFLPEASQRSRLHEVWTQADGPLPALFLSHGAPPLFDDGPWMHELFEWAWRMPKPRAILMVSAHWESAPLSISSPEASVDLVYDFGGFDQRYYAMQYRTPDATSLARQVAALMPDDEPVHQHRTRGLDHGAWVPLKVMYPLADIPAVQLSLPTHDPERLLRIGRRLRPLREEGVLIIGSGFMTHGLPFLTGDMIHANHAPSWSTEFDEWAWRAAAAGDIDTLASYAKAPGMPYAHPTAEHFSPMFIALGAASDNPRPQTSIDGYMWGLAKRSLHMG